MPPSTSASSSRRPVLLLLLVAVLGVALQERNGEPDAPVRVAAVRDSAPPPPLALSPEQRADSVRVDSADRSYVAALTRDWLGPQRWVVTPGGDSLADFVEASLADSSVADVMSAFVTVGALRDSSGSIELLGGATPGRAVLMGNVDSLVRRGVDERLKGCVVPLALPLRRTVDTPAWWIGAVPGMVAFVAPDTSARLQLVTEGLRLLEALPDTGEHLHGLDSLRAVAWPAPSVLRWRVDDVDVLVASRGRTSGLDGKGAYVQQQIIVAERPAGSGRPFATVVTWHSAFDTDETRSEWLDGAVRIGPERRFALLLGQEGKEGGGGVLLVRRNGKWSEAVSWSSGC